MARADSADMADIDEDGSGQGSGKSARKRSWKGLVPKRAKRSKGSAGGTEQVTGPTEAASEQMPDDFGFADYEEQPKSGSRRSAGRKRGSSSAESGEGKRSRQRRSGASSGGGGRKRGRRGGGSGGSARASGGAGVLQQPAARIVLALVLAGVLILVIALVVRDCQRNQLVDSYEDYMAQVATITTESAAEGEQLQTILTNQDDQSPAELSQQVTALAGSAEGLAEQARGLDPPDALDAADRSLETVLDYRVTGLKSLAEAIPQAAESNDASFAGTALAQPMQRFLASDVIYDDSFVGPAAKALEDDDISGIEVPDPDPFLANAALASTQGARNLVPRIKGESSGGTTADDGSGLRGTSLLSTEALPSGTTLASGQNSTIQASEQLKWRVSVENGGDVDLTNVVVKSSFSYPSNPTEPQEVEGAIESLPAGETGTVELAGPTDLSFGEQGTLSIEVVPVDGEGNTDNNSAEYPVTITI